MPAAHLPSLAALRPSAAPTDANEQKRQRVQPPAAQAVPPPLLGLPRDVIEVMVTQAVLSARKAPKPALAICVWMRDFCRAARVQDVECDDRWFKLALQTFGVRKDAVKLPCMRALPKADSDRGAPIYQTWKGLFGHICNALTHEPTPANKGVWGSRAVPEIFVNLDATQRELDFEAERLTKPWVKGAMDAVGTDASVQWAREKVKAFFTAWAAGEAVDAVPSHAQHLALMTLLLLRGAEIMAADRYAELDHQIWDAAKRLIADDMDAADAREQVRTALDEGASLVNTLRVSFLGENNGGVPQSTMLMAIRAGDAGILNLLLEKGWTAQIEMRSGNLSRYCRLVKGLYRATIRDWHPLLAAPIEWTVDAATTERVIRAVVPTFVEANIDAYVARLNRPYCLEGLWHWIADDQDRAPDRARLELWRELTRSSDRAKIEAARQARAATASAMDTSG
jgi:hypothetical protein